VSGGQRRGGGHGHDHGLPGAGQGRLMEAVPKGVDLAHVRAHILGVPHVHAVHNLHASSVASDLPVLTAHA
jgi:Co/Zn/Cd efflux system component